MTEKCNLLCRHCFTNSDCTKKDISFNTIQHIVSVLNEVKEPTDVIFHGGEPILRCDYIEYILDNIQNTNITFFITTNLCYKITDRIEKVLFKIGNISTSYDPISIRFKTSKRLNLWKYNVNFLKKHVKDLQINSTLTKELIDISPQVFLNDMSSLCPNRLHLERLNLKGRASSIAVPKWEDVDNWLLQSYKENKKVGLSVTLFDILKQLAIGNKVGCFSRQCSTFTRTINIDGSVAGCPNDYENIIMPKFDNKSTFCTKQELNKKGKCLICELYKYCNGDCYQQNWQGDVCAFPKNTFFAIQKDYLNQTVRS